MKKLLKITLGVVGIIILIVIIDLVCIFTINRPIFSQGEDYGTHAVYKGLFFNTYVCPEFSTPQIKIKGAKYTCAVLEVDEGKDNSEEHHFKAKVIEVHDGYIIVEPSEGEEERKSSNKFHIDNKNNVDYKKGQILAITYIGGINESYPAQIGVTNISIVSSN
ncbi:MAG: hypothetical protein E7166_06915 [Firmicutes bacterium]|nr:hypothetical protein [Bacillota bacterium]